MKHQHFVSIKSVIGKFAGKLQLKDISSSITQLADWAVDAQKKIGSRNSFARIECEIEVKNYRACLPMGFARLIAVKHGGAILDVTQKDFRDFSKSLQTPKVDDKKFVGGNLQVQNPGQPNVHQVNLFPVFAPGDVITISVTQDSCGDATINSFTYVVQPADTLADILAALVAQINAVPGLPYQAVPDSSYFQIMALTNLVNLQIAVYTNSTLGRITTQLISRRILPTTTTVDNCADDCKVPVKKGSENLAERSAALLNDSFLANGTPSAGNLEGSPLTSKYVMDNGFLHFNAIESGRVGIAYYGLQLDDEGWPMIFEGHVDAVTQYLMWQWDIPNVRSGKVTMGYLQSIERRWYTLCAQARGEDELLSPDELDYLANMWNQLLPLPSHNLF
jgi:hypothetical protein